MENWKRNQWLNHSKKKINESRPFWCWSILCQFWTRPVGLFDEHIGQHWSTNRNSFTRESLQWKWPRVKINQIAKNIWVIISNSKQSANGLEDIVLTHFEQVFWRTHNLPLCHDGPVSVSRWASVGVTMGQFRCHDGPVSMSKNI